MRFAVALAFLLTACATSMLALSPPERVAGCWVSRVGHTMQWGVGVQPNQWLGEVYEAMESGLVLRAQYALTPTADGWQVCDRSEGGSGACWKVAQGESGSLEGGRAFIDRYRDRVHLSIIGGDGRDVIRYIGDRQDCSAPD